MHCSTRTSAKRSGFSLLEVVLATAILALLLSGAFAIVQGSVELGAEITEQEDRALTRARLVEILRQNIRNLQPEANLLLTVIEKSGSYSPELAFLGDGAAFALGGGPGGGQGATLIARPTPGGFFALDLLLLPDDSIGKGRKHPDARKGPRIELLPELAAFSWRVYDPVAREWVVSWGDYGRRPSQIELTMAFSGDLAPQRYVFWVPPVVRLPAERFMNLLPSDGVNPPGTGPTADGSAADPPRDFPPGMIQ